MAGAIRSGQCRPPERDREQIIRNGRARVFAIGIGCAGRDDETNLQFCPKADMKMCASLPQRSLFCISTAACYRIEKKAG